MSRRRTARGSLAGLSSTWPSPSMCTPLEPMPVPTNSSRMPWNGGSTIGPSTGLGVCDGSPANRSTYVDRPAAEVRILAVPRRVLLKRSAVRSSCSPSMPSAAPSSRSVGAERHQPFRVVAAGRRLRPGRTCGDAARPRQEERQVRIAGVERALRRCRPSRSRRRSASGRVDDHRVRHRVLGPVTVRSRSPAGQPGSIGTRVGGIVARRAADRARELDPVAAQLSGAMLPKSSWLQAKELLHQLRDPSRKLLVASTTGPRRSTSRPGPRRGRRPRRRRCRQQLGHRVWPSRISTHPACEHPREEAGDDAGAERQWIVAGRLVRRRRRSPTPVSRLP